MKRTLFIQNAAKRHFGTGKLLLAAVLVLFGMQPLPASAASQTTFKSPEAAITALRNALKSNDVKSLAGIFGEDHRSIFETGDTATDVELYAEASQNLDVFNAWDTIDSKTQVLLVGADAWPFPIPLVREKRGWRFASELGEEELVNRRIGRNELAALEFLTAYVDAQRQYASKDRNGDTVLEYAMKFGSAPGQRDGLYWEADETKGEELSPFGPLVAENDINPETRKPGDAYSGYQFRLLTRQGAKSAGGAYDYVINGRMVAGYALIAYPDEYGTSGIMTFIINQDGRIFQRDLGKDTANLAAAIAEFDPGDGWTLSDE